MGLFKKHKKQNEQDMESSEYDLRHNQQLKKLREVTQIGNEESMLLEREEEPYKEGKVTEKSEEKEIPKEIKKMERKKVNRKNKADCLEYVKEQAEIAAMAQKQLMETKIEYGAVTAYLTDIQKIDQIPSEDKNRLVEAARRTLNLSEERNRFQNREVKISDIMYKHLEKYEEEIPNEIVKMKENEEYEGLVQQDLRNLEAQKVELDFEKDGLQNKKSFIQTVSIISTVIVVILVILFLIFQAKFEMDVTIPILLTVMLGCGAVLVIFLENNRTNAAFALNERKINKVIGLMNKVKIKFVNNRNNLDYTYQKYRVHSSKELSYLWEQYVILKDETRRYQQNTELLDYYHNAMLDVLKEYDIDDADVWLYQPLALIDGKEMVEVRHRLNTRRQKLREQIDYNNSIIRDCKSEITQILNEHKDLEYQVDKIERQYEVILH